MRIKAPVMALLLMIWLTGCGQKGPLYLPAESPQTEQSQDSESAQPATEQ